MDMSSITLNPVSNTIHTSTQITGNEKLVTIGPNGKPYMVSVNSILDKVDDSIADRVKDQVMDQIMESVDEKVADLIDDKIDEALDNITDRLEQISESVNPEALQQITQSISNISEQIDLLNTSVGNNTSLIQNLQNNPESIRNKGIITSYDELTESGHYSGTCNDEQFVLFVLVNNSEIAQIKLKYNNQQALIEKRVRINGIWSEWNDITRNTINLAFVAEDSNYVAYYTGNSGSLVIELPSEGIITLTGEIGLNGYYELENGTLTGTSFTKFLDMTGITSVKIVSNVNPTSAKIYT